MLHDDIYNSNGKTWTATNFPNRGEELNNDKDEVVPILVSYCKRSQNGP